MSKLRLYKFYPPEYVLDNVAKQRLKISTLSDLNDPFEFRSLNFSNRQQRQLWEDTRAKLFDGKGIICFCRDWSNPVIWSHYAQNHTGLALGFDVDLANVLSVSYQKSRIKVPNFETMNSSELLPLVFKALSTKFLHWQYKNEVRTFVSAEEQDPSTGLYFKDFDENLGLREVIIGANSSFTSRQIVEATKNTNLQITTARLAFKKFRVTRQRAKTLQR